MKSCQYKKKHFFTLLEVLVSMGVFTVLMLALMQFFSASQTVWEKTGNRTETFESVQRVVQLLKQDLASAFYGDALHQEKVDSNSLRFFQYKDAGTRKHLTFATDRENGVLTEVNYLWISETDSANDVCTLSIAEIKGSDVDIDSASSKWVTKDTSWLTEIQGAAHTELLQNVIFFDVKIQHKDTNTLAEPDDSCKQPPAAVYITLGVITENALEKIGKMASTPITNLTGTNRKSALVEARKYFNEVFDANGFFKKDSLNEGVDNLPQRRLIHEGTQFFNILVHIDR